MLLFMKKELLPEIQAFVEHLDFSDIPKERKELLDQIIAFIQNKRKKKVPINLNFICTHNSRRSQLCQVWAQTAADYYSIDSLHSYSGGTAVTAFHPNAIRALENYGFRITTKAEKENPVVSVKFSSEVKPILCYSKRYENAVPNSEKFAAILTCSDAEAACPFIPEAEARFSLKYEDPKKADGTVAEEETYAARNHQIATEMCYIFSNIRTNGS